MRKFIKIVSCIVGILFLCSCESNIQQEPITEIINSEGIVFDVNLVNRGNIEPESEPVDSDYIIIESKKYSLPIHISDMIKDGWNLKQSVSTEKIKSNSLTTLIGEYELYYNSYNEDDVSISMNKVYNETNDSLYIEDSKLTAFSMSRNEESGNFGVDFILPGGITPDSTAADIVAVYGDPNNTKVFDHGTSEENTLEYIYCRYSKYNFYFAFDKDGTLNYISITSNIYK